MTAPPAVRRLGQDLVVETHREGTTLLVSVVGEVDVATAPLLRAVLDGLRTARPRRVEVDLSGVAFLDSQGLTVLVAARRRLAAEQIVLALRAPSRAATNALIASGLDRAFPRAGEPEPAGAGRPAR
ncbi:MAG TPA: STAS domain-containing protein [Mycobacteriales bacterium]